MVFLKAIFRQNVLQIKHFVENSKILSIVSKMCWKFDRSFQKLEQKNVFAMNQFCQDGSKVFTKLFQIQVNPSQEHCIVKSNIQSRLRRCKFVSSFWLKMKYSYWWKFSKV